MRGFDPSFFINKKKVLLTHMSGISKFKRIYSEGVAAEHPDVAGQKEFANRADAEITRRRKERAKKGGPQLPGFVPSVKKEEVELGEKIDVGADVSKTISDFVHSKSKTFKGDSKKQRINRALGAYYGAQKEETEMKDIEEKFIPLNKSRSERSERRVTDLNSRSLQAYRSGQPEPGEHYAKRADKIADTTLELLGGPRRTSGSKRFARKEREGKAWANKTKGENKRSLERAFKGPSATKEELDYSGSYDYVIETLIDCEFAQDYETAENMFDALSEGFVSVILEEYIEEAKRPKSQTRTANAGKKGYDAKGNPIPKVSTTHVIHDVDDNLADQRSKDAAKIDVMRNNTKTKSLTPGQFAHHKLEPGDKYGFDEFRSFKKFKDTTKPIKPVARIGDSKKRSAKKSVVTARGGSAFGSNKPSTPMDESFAKDLRDRIGVRGIEKPNIHFTGGMSKGSNKGLSGPEKKAKVVAQIVNPDTKKVITTDDHLGNTRAMAAAASAAAPQAKVIAYQSRPSTRKPKGKGKVGDIVPSRVGKENKPEDTNIGIRSKPDAPKSTTETQRARKKARKNMGEEMTPYEYWKQYIA